MGVARLGAIEPRRATVALIGAIVALGASAAPASALEPCGPPNAIAVIAGARPLPCWRPYVDSSPWNLQVDSSTELDPRSAQLVAAVGTPGHVIAGWADSD